jgi:uncharacterized protein YneF (UPF0154 family)
MKGIDTLSLGTITKAFAFPDTVRVSLLEAQKTWVDNPWIVVILTGLFTLIGVFIGQLLQRRTMKEIYNQQGWLNRDKEMFIMRMDAFTQIAEAMAEMYHVTAFKSDGRQSQCFPSAYLSYVCLKNWNNSTTKLVDKKLLLLDQSTYNAFTELNHLVLKHLDEIEVSGKNKKLWDRVSRNIGRRDCGMIQEKQAFIIACFRSFIHKTYGVVIEEVR